MRFSVGRVAVVILAPVIAGATVAVILMLLGIIAAEMAITIQIPAFITYTGTMDAGGGGRSLRIDGSWAAATAVTGILAAPIVGLALFLPD